ncbi:IucA/IucC family C-terminal-domain containing protein [Brevundimonas diminuta]|uniref:IucA/IucC family C-terminal-domain containing protein n=1 Tax=Brevundimonas diminuta TaxID=293 RepID=UPI003D08351B
MDRPLATIIPAAQALNAFGRPLPPTAPRPARFAATLDALAALDPRFMLAEGWSGGTDDCFIASELTDAQLDRMIALRAADLKTADLKVAANMWFQWYCCRLTGPVLGGWMLHGRAPDVSAENIAFRIDAEGRPQFVAMVRPRVSALPGDRVEDRTLTPVDDLKAAIVSTLLDDHLLPLGERLKARYRLGAPIIRGTIASQIGTVTTLIDARTSLMWEHTATALLDLLALATPQIDGLDRSGAPICVQGGGRTGTFYRRGTCCLVYRAPDREKCGICPLTSEVERAAVYAERLAARPQTPPMQAP